METTERVQQESVQKSTGDKLRRMWALSVFVILAWREGKRRVCGHRVSFLIFRVLGNGLGKGT